MSYNRFGQRRTATWVRVLQVIAGVLAAVALLAGCVALVRHTQAEMDKYATWCAQQGGVAEFEDDEWECELPDGREVGTDGRIYLDD